MTIEAKWSHVICNAAHSGKAGFRMEIAKGGMGRVRCPGGWNQRTWISVTKAKGQALLFDSRSPYIIYPSLGLSSLSTRFPSAFTTSSIRQNGLCSSAPPPPYSFSPLPHRWRYSPQSQSISPTVAPPSLVVSISLESVSFLFYVLLRRRQYSSIF